MAKLKMTPSGAIVETLVAEGVDHVSGIVGSAFMDMLDLFPAAGIRFVADRWCWRSWWTGPSWRRPSGATR